MADGTADTTFVGFVRAVMIGREGLHRDVLLDLFERAGAREARSYISTGNVSFRCDDHELIDIVDDVEHRLEALLGRPTEVFARSCAQLATIRRSSPFDRAPFSEPGARLVTMFRDGVPSSLQLPIESDRGDYVVFEAGEREVFSVTREVDGRMRDPGGVIERLAGERMTTRAWGTIERILDKLPE